MYGYTEKSIIVAVIAITVEPNSKEILLKLHQELMLLGLKLNLFMAAH